MNQINGLQNIDQLRKKMGLKDTERPFTVPGQHWRQLQRFLGRLPVWQIY